MLLSVTVCAVLVVLTAWLPKGALVRERLTRAGAGVPLPERLTVCGLPLALSVMLSEAVRLPLAEGVNLTLIVQLAPAASDLPHVLVCAKLLPLLPLTARLAILKGGVARVAQGDGLRRTGRTYGLAAEGEAGG